MKRAAIYVRISRDRTGEAAGVARQEAECRGLADRRGWAVEQVYSDNDISASSGRTRPAYRQLLADLSTGEVDALVAFHPDRLYRRMVDLEELISVLEARHVEVATVSAGDVDLATPAGRATARIIGAMARYESEQKGARHKSKHRELAAQGKWSGGGRRRFGYVVEEAGTSSGGRAFYRLAIRPDEADLLRAAADAMLGGASLNSIARRWNEDGVRTTGGRRWTVTDVRRVLLAPQAAGRRVYGPTGEVTDSDWPAILSPATHDLLVARLNDPARRSGPDQRGVRHGRRYVLSGLATCGLCGTKLNARKRKGKSWGYWCSSGNGGCGRLAITGYRVDDFVMEALSQRPPRKTAPPSSTDPEREALLAEIARTEERLAGIDDDYAAGTITAQELRRAKAKIDERREEVQGRLADLLPAAGEWARVYAELDASKEWHDRLISGELTPAEASEAHDWVAAYVERVEILRASAKGARFDPSRVSIVWR